MKALYNEDPKLDLEQLLIFIENHELGWREVLKFQIDFGVDKQALECTVNRLRKEFPTEFDVDSSSIFKKLAWFIIVFVNDAPLNIHSAVADRIFPIPNCNAYMAIVIAVSLIHKSRIKDPDGPDSKQIVSRIQASKHSMIEIMDAVDDCGKDGLKVLSLLLEQLTYKSNPDCQYSLFEL